LLYRLCGDINPLHADPAVAAQAGFPRPILHGLATFGMACHGLVRGVCGYDPSRLTSIRARLSAPVYPGETLRLAVWRLDGGALAFRARVLERDATVLTHGRAQV
jgi:acyl dehydratase